MTKSKYAFPLAIAAALIAQSSTFADEEVAAPVAAPAEDAAAAVAAETAAPAAKAAQEDEVAVLIDKTIKITKAEIEKMLGSIMQANAAMIPPEQAEAAANMFRGRIKEQLVQQKILLREADKAGVTVDAAVIKEFFDKATEGRTTLEAEAERAGMTTPEFEEMLSVNLRIQKLIESKTNGVAAATEADAKARYDQIIGENPDAFKQPQMVAASHILIMTNYTNDDGEEVTDEAEIAKIDEAAKKKIDGIREKALADGADFAAIAAEFSDCPSKAQGGSLGQFGRGQMVPEFEEAAFTQEIGAVGEVVKTRFGYHIVKVASREEAKEMSFEDVKEEFIDGLSREAMRKAVTGFVQSVIQAAQVEDLENTVYSNIIQAPAATGHEGHNHAPGEGHDDEPAAAPSEPRQLPAWAQ
jgi:Parvulin-like peptidyl-prolyl isomerase